MIQLIRKNVYLPLHMDKNRNIQIMGIVNLTDDSFYIPSRCSGFQPALERIAQMLDEGADIIDIGACSTRPGSLPVGAAEEWRRLEPLLEVIKDRFPEIRISIDTYWSEVVEKAYELIGKFIVNDISAGSADPKMLPAVGRLGLPYVAMHMRGTPENMQDMTDYDNVTDEVLDFFLNFAESAENHGISDWILDPGFGFAKTIDQNYTLLRDLKCFKDELKSTGHTPSVLVGVSRKSMIYKYLNISPEECLPAAQVLHLSALQNGADILRVHDVAEARRTVSLYKMLA